jgi:hypothetical protein
VVRRIGFGTYRRLELLLDLLVFLFKDVDLWLHGRDVVVDEFTDDAGDTDGPTGEGVPPRSGDTVRADDDKVVGELGLEEW